MLKTSIYSSLNEGLKYLSISLLLNTLGGPRKSSFILKLKLSIVKFNGGDKFGSDRSVLIFEYVTEVFDRYTTD